VSSARRNGSNPGVVLVAHADPGFNPGATSFWWEVRSVGSLTSFLFPAPDPPRIRRKRAGATRRLSFRLFSRLPDGLQRQINHSSDRLGDPLAAFPLGSPRNSRLWLSPNPNCTNRKTRFLSCFGVCVRLGA